MVVEPVSKDEVTSSHVNETLLHIYIPSILQGHRALGIAYDSGRFEQVFKRLLIDSRAAPNASATTSW